MMMMMNFSDIVNKMLQTFQTEPELEILRYIAKKYKNDLRHLFIVSFKKERKKEAQANRRRKYSNDAAQQS